VIIRGGVAKGEPGVTPGFNNSNDSFWQKFTAAGLDELRAPGESRTAFLLRFTLTHPDCHTTIVGTLQPKHLEENVAAALRGPLSAEIYAEAKKRLDAIGEAAEKV